ncbi:MAG: helix-turn-helix domain-containing protein [Ginsengibacter sp.]|jgi:predicted XRE-type DNA-binding protein
MIKKQFKSIDSITDGETYNAAMAYMNELINYATRKGFLESSENNNEYTKEIARIGKLCADFESIYMDLRPLKVKSPLVLSIEKQMKKKSLNQRQAAALLEVKENTFSQILSGKRNVSMKLAKRLYKTLKIDPKTIIEFA